MVCFVFKTGSSYVAQAGLGVMILLAEPVSGGAHSGKPAFLKYKGPGLEREYSKILSRKT